MPLASPALRSADSIAAAKSSAHNPTQRCNSSERPFVYPVRPYSTLRDVEPVPLEPFLPEHLHAPCVFLHAGRPGYHVKSISLGRLNERDFQAFVVEREVPVQNGRLAVASNLIDISGYGFDHDAAFHIVVPAGSVGSIYVAPPPGTLVDYDLSEYQVILCLTQTSEFRASDANGDPGYHERKTYRTSALDQEHHRLLQFTSHHLRVTVGFDPNSERSLANFRDDVLGSSWLPRLRRLEPLAVDATRQYAPAQVDALSLALNAVGSPSIAFPLQWIAYDGTLTPDELVSLVDDHVLAWEVDAAYDAALVEEMVFELRHDLFEKRRKRVDGLRLNGSIAPEDEFAQVSIEARRARDRVANRERVDLGDGTASGRSRKVVGRWSDVELARKNSYYAKSVVVTPSGTIKIQGRLVEQTNSVIRENPDGVHSFLRVAFKDEDGLAWQFGGPNAGHVDDLVDGTIASVLKNGLRFAGRKYEFLSYSQASLRDQGAILVAPYRTVVKGCEVFVDAAKIRESLGTFDKVTNQPAMLGARWSQKFGSTNASVPLQASQIHRIPDIEDHDEQGRVTTCHTDGAGLISPRLRDLVCETLIENEYRINRSAPYPSVFQFRIGGFKGILAVDDTRGDELGIAVRPSQDKFLGLADNEDQQRFVLNISEAFDRPRPLQLNRPLISALEDLGIGAGVFLEYQREAISELDLPDESDPFAFRKVHNVLCRAGLGDASRFQELLKLLDDLGGVPPSILSTEPLLRSALEAARIRILRKIKYKASIPVPESYLLVGVPDEDQYLDEDEIYVAIRDPKEPSVVRYIEGRVALTRSPVIDAGDIRIVTAVGNHPNVSRRLRMRALENCVVLPTKGRRSLASMMGGGDLDGDMYQIITRGDLIPQTACRPASHDPQPPLVLDRPATANDVADCFVRFIKNDLVGPIAIKHLVVSDKSPQHGADLIAKQLADLHSHAVDAPKTGRIVDWAQIPRIPRKLREPRPDFLQKEAVDVVSDAQFYPSPRALGQLYRAIDETQIARPNTLDYPVADSTSIAFHQLRFIVEKRLSRRLDADLATLHRQARLRRTPSTLLRDAFAAHLRDLTAAHAYPRAGGQRISEPELLAVVNLAESSRDVVSRENAVQAMAQQLRSLIEWVEHKVGKEEEGLVAAYAAWVVGLDDVDRTDGAQEPEGFGSFRWIMLSILLGRLAQYAQRTGFDAQRTVETGSLISISSPSSRTRNKDAFERLPHANPTVSSTRSRTASSASLGSSLASIDPSFSVNSIRTGIHVVDGFARSSLARIDPPGSYEDDLRQLSTANWTAEDEHVSTAPNLAVYRDNERILTSRVTYDRSLEHDPYDTASAFSSFDQSDPVPPQRYQIHDDEPEHTSQRSVYELPNDLYVHSSTSTTSPPRFLSTEDPNPTRYEASRSFDPLAYGPAFTPTHPEGSLVPGSYNDYDVDALGIFSHGTDSGRHDVGPTPDSYAAIKVENERDDRDGTYTPISTDQFLPKVPYRSALGSSAPTASAYADLYDRGYDLAPRSSESPFVSYPSLARGGTGGGIGGFGGGGAEWSLGPDRRGKKNKKKKKKPSLASPACPLPPGPASSSTLSATGLKMGRTFVGTVRDEAGRAREGGDGSRSRGQGLGKGWTGWGENFATKGPQRGGDDEDDDEDDDDEEEEAHDRGLGPRESSSGLVDRWDEVEEEGVEDEGRTASDRGPRTPIDVKPRGGGDGSFHVDALGPCGGDETDLQDDVGTEIEAGASTGRRRGAMGDAESGREEDEGASRDDSDDDDDGTFEDISMP
ncbi:hypothetical protein JCM10212_005017 [Sporobolomyces blumeae]